MMVTPGEAAQILQETLEWIDAVRRNPQVVWPNDDRSLLSRGCTNLAIEHAAAVHRLVWRLDGAQEQCGSALALLRPMFEAVVRSWQVLYVFSERRIQCIADGGDFPNRPMKTRVEQIERATKTQLDGFMGRLINHPDGLWGMLCGYTHGDYTQLQFRISHGEVRVFYPDEIKARTMLFASVLANISWVAACGMINRPDYAAAGEVMMKRIAIRMNEAGAHIRML